MMCRMEGEHRNAGRRVKRCAGTSLCGKAGTLSGGKASKNGADSVLGLDLSEKMIARARADTSDPANTYRIADLERLDLAEASFDFAYCSLDILNIEDFGRLARMVHRALVPGAGFVFTIEHPIYMAPAHPGWAVDAEGRKTWPLDGYAKEGPRVTDWLAKGVVKQHRTLGTTLNTLTGTGFTIRHVGEWAPTTSDVARIPALAEETEQPIILIVSARR